MGTEAAYKSKRIDKAGALRYALVSEANVEKLMFFFPMHLGERIKNGEALAIAALADNVPIAVLAFDEADNAAEIIWLYTAPAYRRQGMANGLISEFVSKVCAIRQYDGVAAGICNIHENEFIIRMFKKNGFSENSGLINYFSVSADKLPSVEDKLKIRDEDSVMSLAEAPSFILNEILSVMNGMSFANGKEKSLINDFDPNLSLCVCMSDELKGTVLARNFDDNIELSFLYMMPGCDICFLSMLSRFYDIIKSRGYKKNIVGDLMNEQAKKLFHWFFPDAVMYNESVMILRLAQ